MTEKNRIETLRASESRDAYIRRNLQNQYQDALFFDKSDIPPDVEYRWVRESVLGKPDVSRMIQMKRKGWDPVPISRHPERMSEDSHHLPSHLKGFIFHEGLVLHERLKIYGDIERENNNKENSRVQNTTPGMDHFLNDPSMPMKVFINHNTFGQ